jgi:hypothetical protein
MRWFLPNSYIGGRASYGVGVTSMASGASSLPFDGSEKRSTASVI